MSSAYSVRVSRLDTLKDAIRRLLWRVNTPNGLTWLFVGGLGLRLLLARGGGFPYDLQTFAAWADRLASGGPSRFYPANPRDYFVDYPPGYMYVLWVLGKFSRATSGGAPSVFLLKLPAILGDVGIAAVAVRLAERIVPAAAARRLPWRAMVAIAVLFNPAFFFVSGTWGQVDSALALLVLSSFLLIATGPRTMPREAAGIALLAAGLATKPQGAFVLPLVGLVLAHRHLVGASGRPEAARLPTALLRLTGLSLIGIGTGLALMAPFGLDLNGWLRFYTHAAGGYRYTSVWAFNLWGALGFWRPDTGKGAPDLFGIPPVVLGLAAFAIGGVVLLVLAWRALRRHSEGVVLVFGGLAITCLAFAVLTRMHERYLFLGLALGATLVFGSRMRRTFLALSAAFMANVYFPYVFYVEFVKRKAIRLPGYELFYGVDTNSGQKKFLSLATGVACLFVAYRGWGWLRADVDSVVDDDMHDAFEAGARTQTVTEQGGEEREPAAAAPRPRLTLTLHPVGRRGAAAAAVATLLVALTRFLGLASPPGMYFDEVYHARTAGEYLQHKEVYEWTHPPLAKELIALSIKAFAGFGVAGTARAPEGMDRLIAGDGRRLAWASSGGEAGSRLWRGALTDECGVRVRGRPVDLPVRPAALASSQSGVAFVGGAGAGGPALAAVTGGGKVTVTPLPAPPRAIGAIGTGAFVVGEDGSLTLVSEHGAATALERGAFGVWAMPEDNLVWVTYPESKKVVSYEAAGAAQSTVTVLGQPTTVVGIADADRVLVADRTSSRIEAVDTESKSRADELRGPSPSLMATVPETALAWLVNGRDVRVVEPRGLAVIGSTRLTAPAHSVVPGTRHSRMIALTGRGLACVGGHNTFAWRFGSALFGSLLAGLLVLLAVRLFGSVALGLVAAAFLAVCGLAFTLARIAMNDSYVTAFIVAAWFCALSCLYWWGANADGIRSRRRALGWLAACGLALGLALASKWVGLYALGGIGLLFWWDFYRRGRDGIGSLAGHPVPTAVVGLLLLVGLPAVVYLLSYIPYFTLGHGAADFLRLQKGMYDYHAHLTATHPYGSPWYGWPVGHRAVWLYLGTHGAQRAEIWTAANPVVFVGGVLGIGALLGSARRRRQAALALIPAAALVQFLPWTTVSRVTFLYHYLPEVPFLALALAWWLVEGRRHSRWRVVETGLVLGAAAIAFLALLPLVDGWFVSPGYLESVKRWLSWEF